jgi:hypothetical protein
VFLFISLSSDTVLGEQKHFNAEFFFKAQERISKKIIFSKPLFLDFSHFQFSTCLPQGLKHFLV